MPLVIAMRPPRRRRATERLRAKMTVMRRRYLAKRLSAFLRLRDDTYASASEQLYCATRDD